MSSTAIRMLGVVVLTAGSLLAGGLPHDDPVAGTVRSVVVPGTGVTVDLVACPAMDAQAGGVVWVMRTEVAWELYDIFVYALDLDEGAAGERAQGVDAIARPSKPYVPPDRGFGHHGYPAMGMTRAGAEAFAEWLSVSTGLRFRLPTEEEWTHLARSHDLDAHSIDDIAWHAGNSASKTHPVGQKAPSAWGLHDMLGNVAEWVMTPSGRPVAMGGSYRDEPGACHPEARQQQTRAWNASDPQIPKSAWWLADCSWVGFRLLTSDVPASINSEEKPDAR